MTKTTREWNGSSWGDGGDAEQNIEIMAISGTSSACVYFGGYDDVATQYTDRSEIYNGSTWSDATSLTRNMYGGGSGTSTTNAILPCGQLTSGSDATSQVLDGTTWSDGGDTPTITTSYGSAGSSTDHIKMSGYSFATGDETTDAATLDGTTWSAISAIGIQARYGQGWGSGSTRAWHVGGINYQSSYGSPTPHVVNRTPEYWNGSSWATDTDTPTAGGTSGGKYNVNVNAATSGNTGTQGAMMCFGYNYTGPDTHVKQTSVFEATW